MMTDWDVVFKLIELMIVVVGMFLLYNSIPGGKVREVIDLAKVEAKKTETPIDDLLVQVAEVLNDLREGQAVSKE
jgi:hypothetical protein